MALMVVSNCKQTEPLEYTVKLLSDKYTELKAQKYIKLRYLISMFSRMGGNGIADNSTQPNRTSQVQHKGCYIYMNKKK